MGFKSSALDRKNVRSPKRTCADIICAYLALVPSPRCQSRPQRMLFFWSAARSWSLASPNFTVRDSRISGRFSSMLIISTSAHVQNLGLASPPKKRSLWTRLRITVTSLCVHAQKRTRVLGLGRLYKVLCGEAPPGGPTPYPLLYHFDRKANVSLSYTFYGRKVPLSRTYLRTVHPFSKPLK